MTQLTIEVEKQPKDRYADELAVYESVKNNKELYPVFFCYNTTTKMYSATRLISKSLLESFNFKIIH